MDECTPAGTASKCFRNLLIGASVLVGLIFLPQTLQVPQVECIVRSRLGEAAGLPPAYVPSPPQANPTPPPPVPTPAPLKLAPQPMPHPHPQTKDKWFVCDDSGKVLPIWYAALEKAGSQTLYEDMKPVLRGPTGCQGLACKEVHYFELYWGRSNPYNEWYGTCSDFKTGKLVSDFTPSVVYWHFNPNRLKATYGSHYQEIVLQMGLREPLARTMSAFTHANKQGWIVFRHPHETFADHMDSFFKSWDEVGDPEHWITNLTSRSVEFRTVDQSLYYYCIRRYLDHGFLPSQFIVYPALMYLNHRDNLDTNPVLQAARSKLGPNTLRLPAGVKIKQAGANRNKGHHKTIEEELSKSVRKRLQQEVFGPANEKLMKLLAEESRNGMLLAGYTGQAGDVAAVTKWMTSGWAF